jgi:DNA-binding XRE family transcriptional regulator
MANTPIKYPSPYLRDRRVSLGLTQQQVADAIGIGKWAMQKLEQRGELPEIHFEELSKVLGVTVGDLFVEKYAVVIREVFHIPTEVFRSFIADNIGKDRAFGRKPSIPKTITSGNNPFEDKERTALFQKVIDEVRGMTAEEGFQSLIESGIYTKDGVLAPEYGGPPRK